MKQKFDLLEEDWIPCIRLNGVQDKFSLRNVLLSAHELGEIHGESPLVTASLYRLLLAVIYAIYQPENTPDWQLIWSNHKFSEDQIEKYFSSPDILERFDLLSEIHPFYQTTERIGKPMSLSAIIPEYTSGENGPTLFDHSLNANPIEISLGQAARTIIMAQAFSLGGGKSGIKGKNFTDAPCARGVLCFAEGKNLFETLMLNLVPYSRHEEVFSESDKPSWVMDNPIEDDRAIPDGLLDYLTWQSRRLNLSLENGDILIYRSQALTLDKEAILFDPLKPYRHTERDGYKIIRLSENRALWRDSTALFRIPESKNRPPLVVDWLSFLVKDDVIPVASRYKLAIYGLATKPGKAIMYFSRKESIPLPVRLTVEDNLAEKLSLGLSQTEKVNFALLSSAQRMGIFSQIIDADNKKWGSLNRNQQSAINDWITHTDMERNYWASLDLPFQAFIVELARDEEKALVEWYAQLRKSALSSFQLATQSLGNDARSFKAMVKGESYLLYRLNEVLPESKKEKNL